MREKEKAGLSERDKPNDKKEDDWNRTLAC
jgi:hypothetical protein